MQTVEVPQPIPSGSIAARAACVGLAILLWWVYASREALQLTEQWVSIVRFVLSAMVVLVVVWFTVMRVFARPR
jgi:high-affinity Fe2+/Pb2+ permease